ncbi:hypothetical protein BGX33_004268 [Mortierella sp. NVP41]|nr:hypothetical protein BGX33_004268 [Mortierella sp. NVP41]
MPVLVDVNEPSQLNPQPQQQNQQHHVLCSTRRQPLLGIDNTETFTAKESVSVCASDLDSKENCPPPLPPQPFKTHHSQRSQSLVKKAESMLAQTRLTAPSLLPTSESDNRSKCGVLSPIEVEFKVKDKVDKGEHLDISKETSRIDFDSLTRGGSGGDTEAIAAADSADRSSPTTMTMSEPTEVYQKPDISYSHLILLAISQSPSERLTLREIYAWIETRHPFYRDAPTGWQNSIRHNLSSSKAFIKMERCTTDAGKGCFWTLHENAQEILAASPGKKGRKSISEHDDGALASVAVATSPQRSVSVRSRSASTLPKLDCRQDGSPRIDLPSPAASELNDDPKSPRPLRTKHKEVYMPSTPPSSPDYEADLEDKGGVLGAKTTIVTAMTPEEASSLIKPLDSKTPSTEPVVTTTRRVRRPPPNLSEFVSSEDFKASFGKESSSTSPLSPKPAERKRSKSLATIAARERSASTERATLKEPLPATPTAEPSPSTSTNAPLPSVPIPPFAQQSTEVPLHRLISVPLSSLSHTTHLKRTRDDMLPGTTTKKWRREDQRHRRQRGRSNSLQETYERRSREGKREIVVASEDDWFDSDDDFLNDDGLDGYDPHGPPLGGIRSKGMKHDAGNSLLLDSSAISYGFEIKDAEYILDFNQSPLFNSVVWPEYSNLDGLDRSTSD